MINTRIHFAQELSEVDQTLLRMGAIVRSMVSDAVDAMLDPAIDSVQGVLDNDDIVDTLEEEIESRCLRLLALQQPMARDLRRIMSAVKVAAELERVGDHSVDIAKCARNLHDACYASRQLVDLAPMAGAAERMLDDSLQAFVRRDMDLVRRLCAADDIVNAGYKSARNQLISSAESDPSLVSAATYTLLVVTALERIADHATNIGERVAYLEAGEVQKFSRTYHRTKSAAI